MIDVILAALCRRLGDRPTGLTLGADKQDASAAGNNVINRLHRLIQHGHGLLKIDDMNALAHAEDVGFHLRVPAARNMSEMNAGFQ